METRARRRNWLWMVVVAVVAMCFVQAFPGLAHASDDYPYRDADSSELDERGFYYRHCTSFVAWRMSQRGDFDNYMLGGHWWHARNWAANAEQIGFTVDTTPAAGAIAHWYAGEQGADDLGHVAFVESVHADGSVTVEEYNGTNPLGYSRRGPTHAPRYIHVYDDTAAIAEPSQPGARGLEARSPPVPVEPVGLNVGAQAATVVAAPPDVHGELVAPPGDAALKNGERVTVAAVFSEDEHLSEVRFIATDSSYDWEPIGVADRSEDGKYSVEWTVTYPAGSRISLSAQALDAAGVVLGESVRGLEDVLVIPQGFDRVGRGQQRGEASRGDLVDATSVALHGDDDQGGIVPLIVPGAIFFGSGLSIRRISKRTRLNGSRQSRAASAQKNMSTTTVGVVVSSSASSTSS